MNLVIVESPAKGKTIEKYLGSDYKVVASYGHVRDLPIGELGVDTANNFAPKYVIPTKARKNISNLKTLIKNADKIYLATDYDREGEAIAWHIMQALGLQDQNSKLKTQKYSRITFTEITQDAIKESITKP
ncbi:MAG: toprim domain-containing protein, partial [Patescibacteria group bacterium]|nr:toprim domain-containing protein [Patescibacteria group bacterium]